MAFQNLKSVQQRPVLGIVAVGTDMGFGYAMPSAYLSLSGHPSEPAHDPDADRPAASARETCGLGTTGVAGSTRAITLWPAAVRKQHPDCELARNLTDVPNMRKTAAVFRRDRRG